MNEEINIELRDISVFTVRVESNPCLEQHVSMQPVSYGEECE
jgi:hypothetical protein